MNKTTFFLMPIFLLLTLVTTADARNTELQNPPSIDINQQTSLEQLDQSIWGAMIQRNWVKENQTETADGKTIEAAYYVRTHKILLSIKYNKDNISFDYISSENMKYKEKKGKRYIHPNYLVWTQQLTKQIKTNLELGDRFDFEKLLNDVAKGSNPPPSEPFANFSNFKLDSATLAEPYQGHKGNESTVKNLNHNLQLNFSAKSDNWNKNESTGRTLIIKPQIVAVRFIGTGARLWAGAWAGKSWIVVKVTFTDALNNIIIAEPELFRIGAIGSGFSGAKYDYKMVEDMANDITVFIENNYDQAIGGGQLAPMEVRQQILSE